MKTWLLFSILVVVFLGAFGTAHLLRKNKLAAESDAYTTNAPTQQPGESTPLVEDLQIPTPNGKVNPAEAKPGSNSTSDPVSQPVETTNKPTQNSNLVSTRPIQITNGQKHSIPLNELQSGGPPKDGIPSIDNPKFDSVSTANSWLRDSDPGIAYSSGNTHRFYPYQIIVWHELVNDTVEGQRVLISYCPLCLTGLVFDPVVNGKRVEFGTSGMLWQSNLVMYDRSTDSLWSQVLGEAVVGQMTGTKLALLPSDQMRYGEWKKKFSNGQVLSRDTGAIRSYGNSPYGDYFDVTSLALSITKPTDTRIPNAAYVFGIEINGKTKAYHLDSVETAWKNV
jgi:hypothetical protein